MTETDELKKIARKVFRGWVIESMPENNRESIKEAALGIKNQMAGFDLGQAQIAVTPVYRREIPIDWFGREVPLTRKIATQAGIDREQIYEIYIIGLVDFVLSHIYGESDSFAHEKYSDKEQEEIFFKFTLGIIRETMRPDFIATMRVKESHAIKLAKDNGIGFDGIISLIKRSNDAAMNFNDFRRDLGTTIKIFKLGGIKDEYEIFEYFKIFLAHALYQLNQ